MFLKKESAQVFCDEFLFIFTPLDFLRSGELLWGTNLKNSWSYPKIMST